MGGRRKHDSTPERPQFGEEKFCSFTGNGLTLWIVEPTGGKETWTAAAVALAFGKVKFVSLFPRVIMQKIPKSEQEVSWSGGESFLE